MLTYICTMLLVGLFAGILGALLGLGGGIVITPVLTLLFGVDIKYAVGASIIAVLATSSGSAIAYLKDDMLNLRIAMFLEIFTTLGAFVGAVLSVITDSQFLFLLYGALMLFQAFNMYQKIRSKKEENLPSQNDAIAEKLNLSGEYFDKGLNRTIKYQVANVSGGSVVMFFAGVMSALLGIGAGAFKVLAMDTVMKMPLKASSATANFMMGVTGTASAIFYLFVGQINPVLVTPIALGVLVGSFIGSRIMPYVPVKVLRWIFLVALLALGMQMFIRGMK
ncbi:sulfite exporter TauE/SafE family protein [Streptococcus sp. FDAARGOS_146]|uniref:sulfite exporter TauE/SafE family protein n=1 Tax=Streptococcus sp. FDAARGOS_146 TaxID=1702171 RepID=UPI000735C618|nr:sulfite exporter TauE/SafE family protein [Streptococcus sp. FDAARGOS_146]PNM83440.1 sulfite exporter TauE/SafE family protein [Streptococcus sp. FDAARGOS_146]